PAQKELHSPPELNRGWDVKGESGLETALLLARNKPLPADLDLKRVVGRLPPAALHDPHEVAWLEWGPGMKAAPQQAGRFRDLDLTGAKEIDEPILKLMEQLRPHFDLIKAVRFAHQGD